MLGRKRGSDTTWEPVTVGYETIDETGARRAALESNMENLLLKQPRVLLSGLTGGLPVVVIKDFQLRPDPALDSDGDRYPDLLAFDSEGGVYVIECKMGRNPESEAKVLEQVRQYGARLLRLRYADINTANLAKQQRMAVRKGTLHQDGGDPSIATRMESAVNDAVAASSGVKARPMTAPEWEARVDENIVNGSVRLAVAVDHVHAKLHDSLGVWNASLSSESSYEAVWALELLRIEHGDMEFLIPRVIKPRSSNAPLLTTFDETLRLASAAGRAVDGRLVQWAKGKHLVTRTTTKSRQVIGRDGQRLITLYLSPKVDKLELNLKPLADADADAEAVQAMRRQIAALFGEPVAETYPNIGLELVERQWDRFAAEVLEDYEGLRAALPDEDAE